MRHQKSPFKYLYIFSFFVLLSWQSFSPNGNMNQVKAQEAGWSLPVNVSDSATESGPPAMAADPAGGVHMLWTEEDQGGANAILYSYLINGIWSVPNDILINEALTSFDLPGLVCDSQGYLHTAYKAAGITYSSAYAPLAGSASQWKAAVVLAPSMNHLTKPHLIVGSDDSLHLVYAIQIGSYSGIYYLQSTDSGKNWSTTLPVYENYNQIRMVDQPGITIDPNGKLHVVWTEYNYPETFPPLGIRYSSSVDGKFWEPPVSLADGPYMDPAIIALGDQEIHVVWSGTDIDRYKFHRYSKDSGESWLGIWRNEESGGLTGLPGLAIDSQGVLYWFHIGTALKLDRQDWLFENTFTNGIWSNSRTIFVDAVAEQNTKNVTAIISLGNQLHTALWVPVRKSDGDYQGDVFYFHKQLTSPPVEPRPLPASLVSAPTEEPDKQPVASPTTLPLLSDANTSASAEESPLTGIVIGALSAGILVCIVLIVKVFQKR